MTPERARDLLHAYIDEELDPASTMELEAEMATSPVLQLEFERLSALQTLTRNRASRFAPSPDLAHRVFAVLPEEKPGRIPAQVPAWWRSFAIGATVTAVALLSWNLQLRLLPSSSVPVSVDEVLAAHVRSLMADHLTDLASSDRHSVKPWLSNRLGFAPPVQDFAKEGFALIGGRLDYLGGRAVAAAVYRYRQHLINVFIWPAATSRDTSVQIATHKGYNSARLDAGGMSYWAVSDLNTEDLGKLTRLLPGTPAKD